MQISVTYDDSDLARALSSMINHPNKEEFVKLLTPLICSSHKGSDYFFRLLIDGKLPNVIPINSLCKVHIKNLGYGVNKEALLQSSLCDDQEKVIARVKDFRGWHEYSQYTIEYSNINKMGQTIKETTYVNSEDLECIEEI
jgi:hypothetical protein